MIYVVWSHTGSSVQFGADTLAEFLDKIKTHLGDGAIFDLATYTILYNTETTKIVTRSGRCLFLTKPPGHPAPPATGATVEPDSEQPEV